MIQQQRLEAWAASPEDPILNFKLAETYEANGQLAGAVTFYLRAAEFGHAAFNMEEMVYGAMIRLGKAFAALGGRPTSVRAWYNHALAYLPHRPEGYFYAATCSESDGNWLECYTLASMGEVLAAPARLSDYGDPDFTGKDMLVFQKATSAWWIGRRDESVELFTKLQESKGLPRHLRKLVDSNLLRIKRD